MVYEAMVQILDSDLSNTVKQSKLSEEDINEWHPTQFYRNQKKLDKIS